MKNYKIDIVIPTYKPDQKLDRCLRMLKRQTVRPDRILLINTEEASFHSEVFDSLEQGEIVHIRKEEFDHGSSIMQTLTVLRFSRHFFK